MGYSLRPLLPSRFSFWPLNLIGWGVYGGFSVVARMLVDTGLANAVYFSAVQVVAGLMLSGLMHVVYRRGGFLVPFDVFAVGAVLGLSFAAGVLQAGVGQVVVISSGWHNPNISHHAEWMIRFVLDWIVFICWSLAYFEIKAERAALSEGAKTRRAREEARRIELQMLRAQLDPHFLFNSLNSIAAEIKPHPAEALEMVRGLASYLRYSLDHRNQPTGLLASELEAVASYLRIQQARFGNRLITKIDAEPAAVRRIVPSFLLQPLVENAVKHGFEKGAESWRLEILAAVRGTALEIEVRNSGSLDPERSRHVGVGIETLSRRLEIHYPHRHGFVLTEKEGFVCALLELDGDPC